MPRADHPPLILPAVVTLLCLALVSTGCDTTDESTDDLALRDLARDRGIEIGAAVGTGLQMREPDYAEVLAREFSVLTPENSMKFGPIHPEPSEYDFTQPDALVAFAEEHDMKVRGHALVWHWQLPDWVEDRSWTREALIEVMREHIHTVVGRYKGKIYAWDVVNEAVGDNGRLRDTIWLRTIGPEYVALAFQFAHEADPDALLFYNDYSAEAMNRKSEATGCWSASRFTQSLSNSR